MKKLWELNLYELIRKIENYTKVALSLENGFSFSYGESNELSFENWADISYN